MNSRVRFQLIPMCLAVCAVGCSREEVAPPEVAVSVATSPAVAKTENKPAPAPELANANETKVAAAFAPPFPDRVELFEAPKRAQSTVKRDDEHGESVELKGFINVDQPRVVLSIDGVISPVPEGGEKYGVRVIAIQPPSVVLQRGRNRWTATLE